jgi:FixJ family two-component response regulator
MMESADQSIVYVVDDDVSIRDSLMNLFQSIDVHAEAFSSTAEFLKRAVCDVPCCLILDIRMPGSSGLDFQAELKKLSLEIPIIFLTAHGDIRMSVQAMKAGAINFLTKPYRDQDLSVAVMDAIDRDRKRREDVTITSDLRARLRTLTSREQEIMGLVTTGLLNKQVADITNLSEITVKMYRGSAMRKLGARTFADFVRMADGLGMRK